MRRFGFGGVSLAVGIMGLFGLVLMVAVIAGLAYWVLAVPMGATVVFPEPGSLP